MTTVAAVVNISHDDAAFPPAGANQGLIPFWYTATWDGTATDVDNVGDALILSPVFPDVAYIFNGTGGLTVKYSDLDSDGTPLLSFNIGFGAVDGVLDFLIVTGTTGAETGIAETQALLTSSNPWIDVGGLYMIADVTAAAETAAAGTISVGGYYTQNVIESTA